MFLASRSLLYRLLLMTASRGLFRLTLDVGMLQLALGVGGNAIRGCLIEHSSGSFAECLAGALDVESLSEQG